MEEGKTGNISRLSRPRVSGKKQEEGRTTRRGLLVVIATDFLRLPSLSSPPLPYLPSHPPPYVAFVASSQSAAEEEGAAGAEEEWHSSDTSR